MNERINIVWLKRDLRTYDHKPLYEAERLGLNYFIVYLFEPSLISQLDCSERHQQFIYHSIVCMNKTLSSFNRKVNIFKAEATDFFEYIVKKFNVNSVLSYQESGTLKSWNRDKKVKKLLNSNCVNWLDFENQGIVRGAKNRFGWDKNWHSYVNSPVLENIFSLNSFDFEISAFKFCVDEYPFLKEYPKNFQPAGQKYALKYLKSFTNERAKLYNYNISKPEMSRYACSRMSTYLSWGNISVRYVYKYVKSSSNYKKNKNHFTSFLSRLKWRSHFIQKFETDCSYESLCINKGYELIDYSKDDWLINQWKVGKTGFPLIDASMRCLIKTGWLNFRMRAMLVSFLCHYLEQDWKNGVYYMANLFLDYEPGIHYTQFQMQAGVTGVNSIRIYNPIKQSKEKDSEAVFIKKWIPELSTFDAPLIHEPWKLTEIDLINRNIPDYYKKPIISTNLSRTKLIKQLWALRKNSLVKEESKRILAVHVRTKS